MNTLGLSFVWILIISLHMEKTQSQGLPGDSRNLFNIAKTKTGDNRTLDTLAFNKCPSIDGVNAHDSEYYVPNLHLHVFPLLRTDFPIQGMTAQLLKEETLADSPMTTDDFALQGDELDKYCRALDPQPHHPSSEPKNPFWKELHHVVKLQHARRKNRNPSKYSTWPKLWENYTLDDMANAVRNEFPNSQQAALIDHLLKNGGIQMDHYVLPERSQRDSVGSIFTLCALNTWVVAALSPICFLCKWSNGVIRPEEIAYLIATKQFTRKDGVPPCLVRRIRRLQLQNAHDFTAYKDQGCPTHPSWPAMHSTGSTLSTWLPAITKLTRDQYCEALRMDLGVAHARTVAGVHYAEDNYAGLNLGMNVLQDKLPKHLTDNYHAHEDRVRAKMKHLKFDWKDFDPKKCTIAGVDVGERLASFEQVYSY